MVLDNITYLLNQFLRCSAYDYVTSCWGLLISGGRPGGRKRKWKGMRYDTIHACTGRPYDGRPFE